MKKNKSVVTIILFLLISTVGMSQGTTPPPPAVNQPPPVGLPIDGGIVVLLVIGIIYGVYKLLSSRKALKA